MNRLFVALLALTLAACSSTLPTQINAIHQQTTAKLKTDFQGVKAVAVASNNPQLAECADAVLADQLPPLEALDNVQATGVFSALALADAKVQALKLKPSVAQKCSLTGWVLQQFGYLGK